MSKKSFKYTRYDASGKEIASGDDLAALQSDFALGHTITQINEDGSVEHVDVSRVAIAADKTASGTVSSIIYPESEIIAVIDAAIAALDTTPAVGDTRAVSGDLSLISYSDTMIAVDSQTVQAVSVGKCVLLVSYKGLCKPVIMQVQAAATAETEDSSTAATADSVATDTTAADTAALQTVIDGISKSIVAVTKITVPDGYTISSADEAIIKITDNIAEAIAAGTCVITIVHNGISAQVEITVTAVVDTTASV